MVLSSIDFQVIVDAIAVMLVVGFPIMLIFELASRFMNIFLDFVGGKKKMNL